jgi:hypothetical protein
MGAVRGAVLLAGPLALLPLALSFGGQWLTLARLSHEMNHAPGEQAETTGRPGHASGSGRVHQKLRGPWAVTPGATGPVEILRRDSRAMRP